MTPKEAVAAAFENNSDWMMTCTGIVKFILSECELENVGNDEYDNVILRNPEESLRLAQEMDTQAHRFRVDLVVTVPQALWYRHFADPLDVEGMKKWLESALFIDNDRVAAEVHSVVDCNE